MEETIAVLRINPTYLRKILLAFKEYVVSPIIFEISNDNLRIFALDAAEISMIDVNIPLTKNGYHFMSLEFNSSVEFTVGVDFDNLFHFVEFLSDFNSCLLLFKTNSLHIELLFYKRSFKIPYVKEIKNYKPMISTHCVVGISGEKLFKILSLFPKLDIESIRITCGIDKTLSFTEDSINISLREEELKFFTKPSAPSVFNTISHLYNVGYLLDIAEYASVFSIENQHQEYACLLNFHETEPLCLQIPLFDRMYGLYVNFHLANKD